MKLPRDVTGEQLVKSLERLGYRSIRQRGSHIRMSTEHGGGHQVVVPAHRPIKPGTLNAIIKQVSEHHGMTREEFIENSKL